MYRIIREAWGGANAIEWISEPFDLRYDAEQELLFLLLKAKPGDNVFIIDLDVVYKYAKPLPYNKHYV